MTTPITYNNQWLDYDSDPPELDREDLDKDKRKESENEVIFRFFN